MKKAGMCRSLSSRSVVLLLAGILLGLSGSTAHAQDTEQPDVMPPWAPPALEAVSTFETDDGFTVWRKDINVQCSYNDHAYTLDITADPADMSAISYVMTNFDVDYNDPQGCPGGPEVDLMSLNGQYMGYLSGANSSWSVNSWALNASQVVAGSNAVFIDTDAPGTNCWCVGVGYIEVRAKVGFKVKAHTPVADDMNRDFRADRVDLTVTFSKGYDPTTLTGDTFKLEYRNAAGTWQLVAGSFTQLSPERFRFIPDTDLKDGVRHRVTVKGGPGGVKSSGGAEPALDTVWYFHTVPDLSMSDAFDYGSGSVCTPSTTPCPGLELAVFQVARNATMVPGGKDAVARLYLRWKPHADVHPNDQLLETDVESSITVDGATHVRHQRVKRPDRYTATERADAAHTVNVPHTPSSSFGYSATVTPRPQTNASLVTYAQSRSLDSTGRSPSIRFDHYFLQAGDWSSGVPAAAWTEGLDTMTAGAQLVTDTFPVLATTLNPRGAFSLGYTFDGTTTTTLACGLQRFVACPNTSGGTTRRTELLCAVSSLRNMLGGNRFVAATVPSTLCPSATAMTTALGTVLLHLSGNGANDGTIAREVGYIHGISSSRDSSTQVEGFQVRTGINRSFVENPTRAISLMHSAVQPEGSQWFDNNDYDTLLGSITGLIPLQAARTTAAGPYLIVSGFIDVGTGVVDLSHPFLQEAPNDAASASGTCSVETLDGTGIVLAREHVTPGADILLEHRDGSGLSGLSGDSGPQSFSVSLPWSDYAWQLRVSCNGTVLHTRNRGAFAPTVDFLDLANGASLSRTRLLSWSGSDADNASLAYQLQLGDEAGTSWTPLTPLVTSTSIGLDTTLLSSGRKLLRIMVTDGFDTAWAVREVNIVNPLKVVGTLPANGATLVGSRVTVNASFVTDVNEARLSQSTFQLLKRGTQPVSGKVRYDRASRTALFTPSEPLEPNTFYIARLSSSLQDVRGNALGSTYQWSFATAVDTTSPTVIRTVPAHGQLGIPLNAMVRVQFSEIMEPSTLTGDRFQLLDEEGRRVSGNVVTSSDRQSTLFIASSPLSPGRPYTARVCEAASDVAGNRLGEGLTWKFTTGATPARSLRIIGGSTEQAIDVNGDGLSESLALDVDVEVQGDGWYNLNGCLMDPRDSLIACQSSGNKYLSRGVHTLRLTFSGVPIRSNGVDGPYILDRLNFYNAVTPLLSDVRFGVYQTAPYRAASFQSELNLSGLPHQLLEWNTTRDGAFNLRDHTTHATQPVSSVTYRILFNTDPRVHMSIDPNGDVNIRPMSGLEAESDVMIEARDGRGLRVTSVFHVSVQKPRPDRLVAPEELRVFIQQSHPLDVQVRDQWGRLLASTVPVTFEATQGRLSPESVTPSTGVASTTLTAGSSAGVAFVTSRLGEVSTLTRVHVSAPPRWVYPIALHSDLVRTARIGQHLRNIPLGTGAGNFGWLSWTGDPSEPALLRGLTPPGNSQEYVNPFDPKDRVLSVGDWVSGKPGVSASRAVHDAMEALGSRKISVPVWTETRGAGNGMKYRVTSFACIQLTDFKLSGQGWISAVYLGTHPCP